MARRQRSSNTRSRRGPLLLAALILIASGLMLTNAYDIVDAPRTSNTSVTDDPSGLLGLSGYSDTSKVPSFTNNAGNGMDVTLDSTDSVEFDVGNDGSWTTPPVTFALADGSTTDVNIRWAANCKSSGKANVSIDTTLTNAAGGKIGAIAMNREFAVSEAGSVSINGSVTASGNSGKYAFDMTNDGCSEVTLTGIGVNETTEPSAVKVGGKKNDDIFLAGGTSVVSSTIPVDSTSPGSATIVDFDQNVTLAQNETKSFEFDRFRNSRDQGAPMKGEDVKIVLRFSDGSTLVEKLCLNGCDL